MARRILVTLIALIASGCGGSSAGIAPKPAAQQTTATSVQVPVQFSVTVPRVTSGAVRSPRYVSASTKSASIVIAPSGGSTGTPVVVNCTTVCSGQIAAPVGSDTFTMKLFDAANAGGNLLSTGSLTQTIVIDQANTVNVTFNGVVASLAVVLTPSSVTAGTPATVAVAANALDADGNTIVGPGVYVNASGSQLTVNLADSDGSGATHLSQSSLSAPTSGITLSYNGATIANPTITASATGLTSAQAILTITPAATPLQCSSGTPVPSIPATRVYVTNDQTASITVYAANPNGTLNEAPLATIVGGSTGLNSPQGVALDAAGRIYVVNYNDATKAASVTVYAANPSGTLNETPLATIAGTNTGLAQPNGIAIDGTGNIYVANANLTQAVQRPATVTVYSANPSGTLNEAPLATITEPFTDTRDGDGEGKKGVALDACGQIYVTDYTNRGNFISVYAANPRGALSGAPLATMSVTYPDFFGGVLSAVAVDPSGYIYAGIATTNGGAISVYPPNPSGTFAGAPLGTIVGSNTGLGDYPVVAVDTAGPIYSTSFQGTGGTAQAVTDYAANPRGTLNENPLGTIIGSNTGLGFPAGIAVH